MVFLEILTPTVPPIPVALAALYKTSLGLSQVTAALLLADDGVADAPLAELGDGAGLGVEPAPGAIEALL